MSSDKYYESCELRDDHKWHKRGEKCKHLNATCRRSDPIYFFYCPDCTYMIKVGEVFNNWLEELRNLREELKDALRS